MLQKMMEMVRNSIISEELNAILIFLLFYKARTYVVEFKFLDPFYLDFKYAKIH